MSEYWVSHKKFFCKYCNIYIADDAPSRTQHENGLRHKGNVERFVRGLYKAGEKKKHDLEEEKRDMVRVEQAARAAYAQDISSGLVKPGSSSEAGPSKPAVSKPAPKPSDPYSNYTTAASLGYTDPDLERAQAEAAIRQKEGVVGTWEVVGIVEPTPAVDETLQDSGEAGSSNQSGTAGVKREAEAVADEEEDGRGWKLKKKKLGVGLGELYDPGLIPIKLKAKKEELVDEAQLSDPTSSLTAATIIPTAASNATPLPKWTARGWSKPSEREASASPAVGASPTPPPPPAADHPPEEISSELKQEPAIESEPTLVKTEPTTVNSEEALSAPAGGMFRKRKIPAGGRGRRG
ncbi:hypothetical protein C8Q75DRAFT_262315 [Abortiporus biennis]|nr:hypothetical protein C8Q75DRAFT_262315 [Abortiporus biennis]